MEKVGVWIFLITACVIPGKLLCFYKRPVIDINVSLVPRTQVKVVVDFFTMKKVKSNVKTPN